ncbi:MAG TPA: polymer-forming cytoskeletal protein [Candidatus Binatia bacterium]|nr:polymer-forming cytoskeletal protein [Candidatus Binatia bacterium]
MAIWNQAAQDEHKENGRMDAPPIPQPHIVAAPAPATGAKESASKDRRESVFGPGVSIEGKIEGDADLRIAGKFKGDIHIKGDLNVEKGAHLGAKINAANVIVAGEIEGNIVASSQVRLVESGQIIGDLKATTLTVAAGSRMRGHVEFGWSASEVAKFTNGRVQEVEISKAAG